VQNSDSYFIRVFADCQECLAYIDKALIRPKNVFVGVPISFENNLLRIINPSNLPINYEWESNFDSEEKTIEFYPVKGTVKARSFVEIYYKMTYYQSRIKSLYFIINIF
jgi:hypothetical protein